MTFQQSAENADIVSLFRIAIIYGSLWAIGSSWSTAIREIVMTLVPNDTDERVWAELGAAAITTFIGIGVAVLSTRDCCSYLGGRKRADVSTRRDSVAPARRLPPPKGRSRV